jgi:hypothetical protein
MKKINLYALIYLSSVSVFCSPSLSSDEKEMPPVSASRAKRKTQSVSLTAQLDNCPDFNKQELDGLAQIKATVEGRVRYNQTLLKILNEPGVQ